jgi:hypothetical protein
MQSRAAVALIPRLAAILRLDMPAADSLCTSRTLRMGNLGSRIPRSLWKGAEPCRFADHPTGPPVIPVHRCRDRPESVVAIRRNAPRPCWLSRRAPSGPFPWWRHSCRYRPPSNLRVGGLPPRTTAGIAWSYLVVINWNDWSRSIGIAGRHQPGRAPDHGGRARSGEPSYIRIDRDRFWMAPSLRINDIMIRCGATI